MITFSFGKNWKRYVKYVLSEDILQNAQDSLVRYFGEDFDFKNKVFIDIGCGSGIFSLCALRLGVKKVISIDVDKNSIEATMMTKEKFLKDSSENWEIMEGSVLDGDFIKSLQERFKKDEIIVYSWGVLHHTGNLSLAMENVMSLFTKNVAGGGVAYISLYNKTQASPWWHKKKEFYNNTNCVMKFFMVFFYTIFLTFEDIRKGRGFNMYDKNRGMYKITDIIDWLGGLPYEPIANDDVIKIWENKGFECVKNTPTVYHKPTYPQGYFYRLFVYLKVVGLGCNEFSFKKK